jgi:hypothetical protein
LSHGRKATEGTRLSIGAAFGDRIIGFLVFAVVVRFVETREGGSSHSARSSSTLPTRSRPLASASG